MAKKIVERALGLGHEVNAYVRNGDALSIENPILNIMVGELREVDKITSARKGADVCISTLGGASLKKRAIEVTGPRNNEGSVALELLDKNNCEARGAKKIIVNKKCTFILENLKNDQYAIRFFHDENENIEIDKKLIGIPKEGFGLSKDG